MMFGTWTWQAVCARARTPPRSWVARSYLI